MTDGSHSTVRLRRIGRELRKLREDAGYTQRVAGRRLERSASSLSIIENGLQPLRLRDLAYILDVYEAPPDLRKQLLTLAEQELRPGWWDDFRGRVSAAALDYVSLEYDASSIDSAQENLIPGFLQTPDYTRALHERHVSRLSADQINLYVEFRMARQVILERPSPPRLRFALDEAALLRMPCDRSVMRAQLRKLEEANERDNVSILVTPLTGENQPYYSGSFQHMEIGAPAIFSLVLLDRHIDRLVMEDEEQVSIYRHNFDHLAAATLSKSDSSRLIERIRSAV